MNLRLGYFVPQFPGQTHIFFWREIRELEARGVEVCLISTRKPAKGLISHAWSGAAMARTSYVLQPDPVAAVQAARRVPWSEVAKDVLSERRPLLQDVVLALPAAQRLKRLAEARGLSHVHAHSCGRSALIAALCQRIGGPPYSLTLHGPLGDYGVGQRFKWRNARFATVITDKLLGEVGRELAGDLPKEVTVQPMGVDTARMSRMTPYAAPQGDRPLKLFSCARLNLVKGHQDLFAAVRSLLDQGRAVTLEIAGEDDAGGSGFRHELEAKIRELRLGQHVFLLGAVGEDEVKRRLLGADLFVLASWHEPLGVAFMEAMSCAVPTIGTNAGGVRELIVDGRDGLLVPPKDPAALAAAIARVADNPQLAMALSAGGRARVETAYHSGRGAEALIAAIERAPMVAAEPSYVSC